jgi:hypothetical protein
MQVTLAQCYPRLMREKLWKIQVFLSGIPISQESLHVEITDEDNTHHFLRCQGYCSLWAHSTRPNSQPNLLCGNFEAITWILHRDWIFAHLLLSFLVLAVTLRCFDSTLVTQNWNNRNNRWGYFSQYTRPPILLSSRYRWAPSPGVKRPGREADHSPSSRSEVRNAWSYNFTSPYALMAW